MADRDLENRSRAYWHTLATQATRPTAAAQTFAAGYPARYTTQRRNDGFVDDDRHGEREQLRRRRTLSP